MQFIRHEACSWQRFALNAALNAKSINKCKNQTLFPFSVEPTFTSAFLKLKGLKSEIIQNAFSTPNKTISTT